MTAERTAAEERARILAILHNEEREWKALAEDDLPPRSEFIAGGLAALADLRKEITGDRIRLLRWSNLTPPPFTSIERGEA